MSKTLDQVYLANPITSNASTDLMYFVQSPYTPGTDAGMTYANFSAQFALSSAVINLAHGGTNANLTASNGGIFYCTATAGAILSGTSTAGLPLLSGSTAAPAWGAFALSLGGALTTAGALTTSGAFGATFTFTGTTSVTFPTSGTLATVSTSGGLTPVPVSGTTQALASGNAYIFNNAGATTGTLPSSPTVGDLIKVKGNSSAPWIVQANTGQTIKYGSTSSSSAGTATSTAGSDSIQLMYIASNLWSVDWAVSADIVLA